MAYDPAYQADVQAAETLFKLKMTQLHLGKNSDTYILRLHPCRQPPAGWLLAGCWLAACELAGCWLAGWWLAADWLADWLGWLAG